MSASDRTSAASPGSLANQPYLLLCLTAVFWAGNAIVGRLAAGHIPPATLAFLRWFLAFLVILPFAGSIWSGTAARSAPGSAP
jgi:drug/metabolite transporter (DMT)-like permease